MAKKGKGGKGGKDKRGATTPVVAAWPDPQAATPAPAPEAFAGPRRGIVDLIERAVVGRLCYGEPVSGSGRTIVPVTRVRAGGGGGWGGGIDARPVGFIELGPDGTRFEPIPDPDAPARALRAAATAALAVGAALAGLRAVRRRAGGGRPRRLLSRGD